MPSAASDIRVRTTLARHPKWLKLRKLLGNDGRVALLHLWIFAREHRPDGYLDGIGDDEIEAGAMWEGEPGALVQALETCGWLDRTPRGAYLHGWEEHQPWSVNQARRSEVARANANKRWEARYAGGNANGMQSASGQHDKAENGTKDAAGNADGMRKAMLPSPPLPSPPKEGGRGEAEPLTTDLPSGSVARGRKPDAKSKPRICDRCRSRAATGTIGSTSLCIPCTRDHLADPASSS